MNTRHSLSLQPVRPILVLLLLFTLLVLLAGTPALAAPPANDDFDDATVISTLPFTDYLDTREATTAPDDPAGCDETGSTIWYSFTATATMPVAFAITDSSSYFEPTIAIYIGTRGHLTQLHCVNTAYSYNWLLLDATAGQTYYIMIGSAYDGSGGLAWLEVKELLPPANDNAADATAIAALPFSETVDTRGATTEPGDSGCNEASATIWYTYTPTANTRIEARATIPNTGTAIAVYTGTPGSLTQVACYFPYYSSPLQIDLFAGETYHFMVGSAGNGLGGELTFSLTGLELAPAPANDDFDDAEPVVSLPFDDTLDTSGATRAFDDPDCADSAATVWYAFTATSDARLELSAPGSDYNVTISAYTGTGAARESLGCASTYWGETLHVNVQAGETYYFMAGSAWNGLGGSLSLSIVALPAPANDDFDNATVISTLPFTDSVDTSGATRAADDPYDCYYDYYYPGTTVWYELTTTRDMDLQVSTSGSSYQTVIGVYTGTRGDLEQVACYPSYTTVEAETGETYYFMVASMYYSSGGTLALSVVELIPPPNDDFDNATVISTLPFTDSVDTSVATRVADDPDVCDDYYHDAGATVWYELTPTRDMDLRISTSGSSYEAVIGVYTGTRGALEQVACYPYYTTVEVETGETYYLMVASMYSSYGGTLALSVVELIEPPNDHLGDATVISTLPFKDSVSLDLATRDGDDPYDCGYGPTVWYTYTPSWNKRLTLRAVGSESAVSLYTRTPAGLEQEVCQYLNYNPSLEFDVLGGETYYIMLASAWYSPGNVVFSIEADDAYLFLPYLTRD